MWLCHWLSLSFSLLFSPAFKMVMALRVSLLVGLFSLSLFISRLTCLRGLALWWYGVIKNSFLNKLGDIFRTNSCSRCHSGYKYCCLKTCLEESYQVFRFILCGLYFPSCLLCHSNHSNLGHIPTKTNHFPNSESAFQENLNIQPTSRSVSLSGSRGALGPNAIKSSSLCQNHLWRRSGPKSQCNAWSDTHWQPAQAFPARPQGPRGWRRRDPRSPGSLTWHFLIKALNLKGAVGE